MARPPSHSDTRQHLLRAALKHFANSGYAATSVQDIVDDAKLSKPALYYHFKDKAGIFQALVHEALDERYELLRAAAESQTEIRGKLEATVTALFGYFREHKDLMRLSIAAMFAAPGEMPEDPICAEKCRRNFDYVHSLVKNAQANGELDAEFDSQELTFGFYGTAHFYMLSHLLSDKFQADSLTAGRIVELFMAGAAPKAEGKISKKATKGSK
ncbi:MAG TPA: TetR/AcrR family transcriptional regulator [Verrucomicrobiae bacterium]